MKPTMNCNDYNILNIVRHELWVRQLQKSKVRACGCQFLYKIYVELIAIIVIH